MTERGTFSLLNTLPFAAPFPLAALRLIPEIRRAGNGGVKVEVSNSCSFGTLVSGLPGCFISVLVDSLSMNCFATHLLVWTASNTSYMMSPR